MKKLMLLAAVVVVLTALGAALADTAAGSRPLGHVVGAFTADRMGFASRGGPLVNYGSVRITVNAFDRTLDPFPCATCPGPDTGTVTQTFGEGTGQEGTTETYQ